MAANIGGQHVTVTVENDLAVLRIDGKTVSGPLPRLKGGTLTGTSTAFGTTYQLTWPDGTQVSAEQLGRYALNVKVKPASARHGTLTGLLGDDDGSPGNDLVGGNGAALGTSPSADDINHKLADGWRVTASSSCSTTSRVNLRQPLPIPRSLTRTVQRRLPIVRRRNSSAGKRA